MNFIIKKISPEETYIVRHPILRPGKPKASCIFDSDDLDTTIHLGLFVENQLVSICSLVKNSNNLISEKKQYQLRGMATLEVFQKKGLGKHILNYAENLLKKKTYI